MTRTSRLRASCSSNECRSHVAQTHADTATRNQINACRRCRVKISSSADFGLPKLGARAETRTAVESAFAIMILFFWGLLRRHGVTVRGRRHGFTLTV